MIILTETNKTYNYDYLPKTTFAISKHLPKNSTSGTGPSTLSAFCTLLALLQRVKQTLLVAGATEDLMDMCNGV